jgi:hypothetical protein
MDCHNQFHIRNTFDAAVDGLGDDPGSLAVRALYELRSAPGLLQQTLYVISRDTVILENSHA